MENQKIYITSDWHFNHNKNFIYEKRGFSSIQEMNEAIITYHNQCVNYNDIVYCLGDCLLGDDSGIKYLKRLNGNIKIILGNHCTTNRIQLYKEAGFEILGLAAILKYHKYTFYLSHYPTITSNYDIDKPLNRRVINLCGHTHANDPFVDWDKGLIFHAEMDTNNCYPWALEDIIVKIQKKLDK